MAFIIDKDYRAEPGSKPGTNANAVGITGPDGWKNRGVFWHFRMLTDDNEIMYEGRSHSNSSFEPLDCFGLPNAGCTIIQYWENHRWVTL